MTHDNIRMIVTRQTDGGTILPMEQPAGVLYHELRVKCPKCGDDNLLARWTDHGGTMIGSLTCNKCDAVLIEPDVTVKPEPALPQPLNPAQQAAVKGIFQEKPPAVEDKPSDG